MTSAAAIELELCSKWYGQVLGVSEVSWRVSEGVVGLLGPNGAGKSTLMKMVVGLLAPSRGTIKVFGSDPIAAADVRRRVGYCPEHEGMYDELTALEFVTCMARLSGVARPREAARRTLVQLGLEAAMKRRVAGFSKGMRQRTKLATCLVHDPDLLILDEPLTGVDPVARTEIVELIRQLGRDGKTVVVSSHVLHEIESLTEEITVVYRGQLLAEGNVYAIRGLIDEYPHRIRIESDQPRTLASEAARADHVRRILFTDSTLTIETDDPDRCYDLIAETALDHSVEIHSLTSPDNSLSAVFDYLTEGRR